MPKLNQVIAVEKSVKSKAHADLTEAHQQLQKPALLAGISRTYRPKDDEGERMPPESTRVQVRAPDVIRKTAEVLTELFDVVATKDWANCEARADVVVDGDVLLEKAPVTYLLFLEKQLRDLRAEVDKVPVLDSAEAWSFDAEARVFKTGLTTTHKTRKEPRVVVKFEPTEHQPGQAEVFHEDRVVGYWDTVKMSSAFSATRRKQLLDRIDALSEAVKHAREEANEAEAPAQEVAKALLGWVFSP